MILVVVRMQTVMKLDEYHSSRCAPSILIILTIIASFGGLLFGYDTGVVGGALPLIAKDLALNDDQQQWVVSSAVGGAIIGSSISGVLMDNVGRKRVALLSSLIFVLGAIVLSSSDGFQSLLLGINSHQHLSIINFSLSLFHREDHRGHCYWELIYVYAGICIRSSAI